MVANAVVLAYYGRPSRTIHRRRKWRLPTIAAVVIEKHGDANSSMQSERSLPVNIWK